MIKYEKVSGYLASDGQFFKTEQEADSYSASVALCEIIEKISLSTFPNALPSKKIIEALLLHRSLVFQLLGVEGE